VKKINNLFTFFLLFFIVIQLFVSKSLQHKQKIHFENSHIFVAVCLSLYSSTA
jgi:hypothetical protein